MAERSARIRRSRPVGVSWWSGSVRARSGPDGAAGTAAGEEPPDRGVRAEGLEQLDLRPLEGEVDDPRAVGLLRSANRDAEDVTVEGEGPVDGFDGHAEMGNRWVHDGISNTVGSRSRAKDERTDS